MNDELELERQVASLFCVGFSGLDVPSELVRLIERGVRNVILFSRNVGPLPLLKSLIQNIKSRSVEPVAVSVDQEGGRVQRLREGFTRFAPLGELGQTADEHQAHRVGATLGRELRAVGIDWDFAPVLDVDSNPLNPVIGDRSFGSDPVRVAKLGIALAQGLQSEGVASCGKHFPGHGDTHLDSHLCLPSLDHGLERLERVELVPFRAAVSGGVASIMAAHVLFRALDAEYPASMSEPVIRGLLRERLGYSGLVVSDDLEMKAIVDHYGIDDAVVRGLCAGVDTFLICHSSERCERAIDAVVRAARNGEVPRARVQEA
ncbi:MAG TPA: beta-N-acetylhexosaminidase, partial [Polyangiaceae bacterium]|nr:beta-N-acetylhexosaminidase [Polyangiaceae bacterium]